MIKSLPCLNHLGEITFGTRIYRKNHEIILGGIYNVNDYLRLIYKYCLFIIDDNLEYLCFKIIKDGKMIIKNRNLKKMLKEKGRMWTITMYINRYFHMTNKQLDYVLNYKDK